MTLIDQTLQQTTEQTLEALAFAFPIPPEEFCGPNVEEDRRTVAICFGGKFSGQLFLSLSQASVEPLVANMLGELDRPISIEQQRDGLKELLNIVCGNLLPALFGDEAVFYLQSPQCRAGEPAPDGMDGLIRAGATLLLDVGKMELRLFVEPEAAAV